MAGAQLAELPVVTALDGLRASGQLVELLTGRRWYVMQQAKEDGASWEQIGEALGMSRQSAWEWYRRKIAGREQHVGDLHDAVQPVPYWPRRTSANHQAVPHSPACAIPVRGATAGGCCC